MKNLNENEMKDINGGNVPTAFYMDSDVINVVGPQTRDFTLIVLKTVAGLGKELLKAIFL